MSYEASTRTPSARRRRLLLIIAGAALGTAALLAAVTFRANEPTTGEQSCGSVFLPVDTWKDCIDRRNGTAILVGALALVALVLAGAAALQSRAPYTEVPRAERTRTQRSRLVAAGLAAVAFAICLIAVVGNASGDARCGAALTHVGVQPTDAFGNVDDDCVRAYQERWLVAGVGAVTTAAASSVAVASRRSSQASPVIAGLIAAIATASVAMVWVIALGWLTLAQRGGA